MYLAGPIHWTDPKTWPWIVYAWIALTLGGFLKPLWATYQKRRAESWPSANGKIESAEVINGKRRAFLGISLKTDVIVGILGYSYSTDGTLYKGSYEQTFGTQEEAHEFVRELEGMAVTIQYNPGRPSNSVLLQSTVDPLLLTRPQPLTPFAPLPRRLSPAWSRPFLKLVTGLALTGLIASLYVHIGVLAGHQVGPDWLFVMLHIGIFVVWIPAFLVAKERVGNSTRKDYWKLVLKGLPDWMRYTVYFFFAYAFANFALYTGQKLESLNGTSGVSHSDWRGFSGHWMLFYSAAFATMYAALQAESEGPHCVKGHQAQAGDNFCRRCGQPIVQSSQSSNAADIHS